MDPFLQLILVYAATGTVASLVLLVYLNHRKAELKVPRGNATVFMSIPIVIGVLSAIAYSFTL